MNPATKNNVLTWAVVLLILANVTAIIIFWTGHRDQQKPPPGKPSEFLIRELGLDEKQREQLHVLAEKHHEGAEKIRENVKGARDHFFDLMKQGNVNDSAKNAAAEAISTNLKDLELLTFDHFRSVRMICTPAQQIKFDQIIDQVMKMVAAPPPGPPGGRRPGPPGDAPQGEGPPDPPK